MSVPTPAGGPRMVTSAERLRRLLALVPYVVARRAVGLAETAATFGMTERELIDDLNLAWCVELKSPEPYCPIDLSYEDGLVTISQAESIARPLRLAADEASALLVALRMLAEAGGDGDAVTRLIAKIEDAAGASAAPSSQLSIQIEGSNETRGSRRPRRCPGRAQAGPPALLRARPRRGDRARRGPDQLLVVEGRTYLRGVVPAGRGGADIPARPGTRRRGARRARLGAGGGGVGRTWTRGCSGRRSRMCGSSSSLPPGARWVAEYYPCESVTELGEGRLRIVIRTPDTSLVRRLALRLGEEARVTAPAELADEVRAAAAAALALYD